MNQATEDKLLKKKTRPTSMRILVYDYLNEQESALSLGEIEQHFHQADRITIYRTLKTFKENGIVHSIQENHTTKYKLCEDECDGKPHRESHLHFYCKICKQTTCKEDIVIPQHLQATFRIDEIRFFAKGICENCLDEGNAMVE